LLCFCFIGTVGEEVEHSRVKAPTSLTILILLVYCFNHRHPLVGLEVLCCSRSRKYLWMESYDNLTQWSRSI